MWPFRRLVDVSIGEETDEALAAALAAVLDQECAELLKKENYVVGSQDILWAVYRIGRERLTVKSETYEGVTLSGSGPLVGRLARKIAALLAGEGPGA